MPLEVFPATNEHERAVTALFSDVQVTIDGAFWERAFGAEAPKSIRSRPFAVVDEEGVAAAFGAVRPAALHAAEEEWEAQVLHDFVVAPGPTERDAAALLLRELVRMAPLTLSAGAGLEGSRLLDQNHFQLVGHFDRLVFDPEKDSVPRSEGGAAKLQPIGSLPENVEACNEAMAAEQRIFRPRRVAELHWLFGGPAGGFELYLADGRGEAPGYAVLRVVAGREGKELIFVDGWCAQVDARRYGVALATLARERHMSLHVSVLGRD